MKHGTLDKVFGTASAICAIHCLFLPILLVILPYIGMSFVVSETFEIALLIFSCLGSTLSIGLGFLKHKQIYVFFPVVLGIFVILIAHFILKNEFWHAMMSGLGGLNLVLAAFLNYKLCGACKACQTKEN